MYPFIEELVWAAVREREEAAGLTRTRTAERHRSRSPLRSRLARKLVRAGIHLDRTAGESELRAAGSGRC